MDTPLLKVKIKNFRATQTKHSFQWLNYKTEIYNYNPQNGWLSRHIATSILQANSSLKMNERIHSFGLGVYKVISNIQK